MLNLFEDPTLLLVGGAILELLLLVSLLQTGRGVLLAAMVVVAAVVAGGWAMEWFVITDREAVQSTLEATADALEQNDVAAVLSLVADDAVEVRQRLGALLPAITIEQAKIRDLDIQVQARTNPKTARVTLRGIIHGRDKSGQMPYDTFMRRFAVRLRQVDNRWVITDYEELPQDGLRLPE